MEDAKKLAKEVEKMNEVATAFEVEKKLELPVKQFSDDQSESATKRIFDGWKVMYDDTPIAGIIVPKEVTTETKIVMNKMMLSTAKVGDTLRLLVNNSEIEAVVKAVDTHTNGTQSVRAQIGDQRGYSAVFTNGKEKIYGTIHSPQGEYELEAKAQTGEGWVYSTKEFTTQAD
jgi:hypothetical protein